MAHQMGKMVLGLRPTEHSFGLPTKVQDYNSIASWVLL